MSVSYTVTLNDNVVSKLQSIVGGSSSPSIVTQEQFNEAIAEGSTINVSALRTLLASKIDDLTTTYNVNISGIFSNDLAYVFGQEAYQTSDYQNISDILDNLESEIESVEYVEYVTAFENQIGIFDGSDFPTMYVNGYIIFFLTYRDSNEDDHAVPLTLAEITSFINAPTNA